MTDARSPVAMEPLAIAWATAEPDRLAARLTAIGFTVVGGTLRFAGATIRLEHERPADRLRFTTVDPAIADRPLGHPNGVIDLAAVGLATVDVDRAADAYAAAPAPRPDDAILGARAVRVPAGPFSLVLLEPISEGRLAATLARHGEGPAVLYLAAPADALAGLEARLRAAGERTRTAPGGPLGRSLAVVGPPGWGPHLVFVEAGPERVPSGP